MDFPGSGEFRFCVSWLCSSSARGPRGCEGARAAGLALLPPWVASSSLSVPVSPWQVQPVHGLPQGQDVHHHPAGGR